MEHEIKRNLNQDDFQTLINESIRQAKNNEKCERRDKLLDFLKVALTPLVITLIGVSSTYFINRQQLKTTEMINQNQTENARIIAAANREQSQKIAESDQQVEKIKHITSIYKEIIDISKKTTQKEKQMMIQSLEAYGQDAIFFLSNIRANYETEPGYEFLAKTAKKTIIHIKTKSLIDLSEEQFQGEDTAHRKNMREIDFRGYNLSKARFNWVNLYRSTFEGSYLAKAVFYGSDLYETAFLNCQLTGVRFETCDLRKANFDRALIDGVEIKNSRMEGAFFPLGSLLKIDRLPFNALIAEKIDDHGKSGKEKYISLFPPHLGKLKEMKKDPSLKTVLTELKMEYEDFIETLNRKKEASMKFAKKKSPVTFTDAQI